MTEYNKIQVDYRDESKKKIARQMEIAGSAVTDDELERMLEGGDGAMLMGHVKIEGNEDQLRYNSISINFVILNLITDLDYNCSPSKFQYLKKLKRLYSNINHPIFVLGKLSTTSRIDMKCF